ncbi:unnamed protein product [Bursaphelenchus xylophilus]|uniref:(pine wood nematode) hypothetical protein n=1 Tax=Bursaphelenchus xylophilus TaxID=6326 RepID=A0A1I7S3A9_BURXY|nr:unnamed protein product [Bursaphelenchus xylophilus]CAG9116180.1 unnamed protein product [Bursaphelenchus xylophilus]
MTGKERRESESSSGSSGSDSSSDGEEETSPQNDTVFNKYTMAGEIVNTVLKELIAKVKEGVTIGELCDHGDNRITELTGKLFKKDPKVNKGLAMPTCVSVDNIVCHYSPLKSDEPVALKDGQVVKIDLGAHVDGFVAHAAHTTVVGASKDNKVSGKKANVILGAYNALEAALRHLHPSKGKNSQDITDVIDKVTKIYDVKPVENMLSHQYDKYKITGEKQIIQNPTDDQKTKVEKFKFENYEVYGFDILVTTGDGKVKQHETRTTVFKKNDDFVYSLKMKVSRAFLTDATKRFQNFPFSLRAFEEETKAKMGSVECSNHGLIQPYHVLVDKDSELVAHFKATAIILPNGIIKVSGLPLETDLYETDVKIEDKALAALLQESLKPKKKKPAKKTEAN